MAKKKRNYRCITCRRPVEIEKVWAAGPVCYPCFWGAKLYYEAGVQRVEDIDSAFTGELMGLFTRAGYSWPFDLIEALEKKPFEKANTQLRRWWSPDRFTEALENEAE